MKLGGVQAAYATDSEARFVHDQLRALVLAADFPCVGARAAVRHGHYGFGLYDDLGSHTSAAALAIDLAAFCAQRRQWSTNYSTFIAAFRAPSSAGELEFEALLWQQLAGLRDVDRIQHPWDPTVSSDPADPRFAFSFGGEAFFVVGLHAASSRYARRFAWPALCFNPHDQFEAIRRSGHFRRMRDVVRRRDETLQGTANPMLRDYGEGSEAAQYSGRRSGEDWRCPVSHAWE